MWKIPQHQWELRFYICWEISLFVLWEILNFSWLLLNFYENKTREWLFLQTGTLLFHRRAHRPETELLLQQITACRLQRKGQRWGGQWSKGDNCQHSWIADCNIRSQSYYFPAYLNIASNVFLKWVALLLTPSTVRRVHLPSRAGVKMSLLLAGG